MSRSVSVAVYVYGPLGADPFNIKCYCSDLGINLAAATALPFGTLEESELEDFIRNQ